MSEQKNNINPIEEMINIGKDLCKGKCFKEALSVYKSLLTLSKADLPYDVYKNIIYCFSELKRYDEALPFLKKCEQIRQDDPELYRLYGDAMYYGNIDHDKAIVYYQKYTEFIKTNGLVYNMLGHLYSCKYKYEKIPEQLAYFEKAVSLIPTDRSILKNLIIVYQKVGNDKQITDAFQKLMKLDANHDDFFDYGAFLVKQGNFAGYNYLKHRFQKENGAVSYPKVLDKDKLWNGKRIKNSTLLVHYEQGFGDTFMFCRFVKELKTLTNKVIFVVQREIADLIKNSDLGAEVYPAGTDLTKLQYDYHVPLMDLPYYLHTTADKLPYTKGYLKVPEGKIKEFKDLFIGKDNDKKLKIGIAFSGSASFGGVDRDIPLKFFYDLGRIKGVQLYSFQVGDAAKQLDEVPEDIKIINLGQHFGNFTDTAAAVCNMDLMVGCDCGVLNLSGALGARSFLVLNHRSDYRWFKLGGNDVGWYKSMKAFVNTEFNQWTEAMAQVEKEIKQIIKDSKSAKTSEPEKPSKDKKNVKTSKNKK